MEAAVGEAAGEAAGEAVDTAVVVMPRKREAVEGMSKWVAVGLVDNQALGV